MPFDIKYLRVWIVFGALLLQLQDKAQCLTPFTDFNNFVYVFDDGQSNYIENLPIRNFKVGKDMMMYVGQNGRLKVYYGGKTFTINDNSPNYFVTDNFCGYQNFNQIKLFYGNQFNSLESQFRPDVDSVYFSDSLVVWGNALGEINAFYNGNTTVLTNYEIRRAKISDNMFAFIDVGDLFKVFYHGEVITLESYEPVNFLVDRDLLVYIDQFSNYKYFYKGKSIETSQMVVNDFWTGEDFAAYISQLKQLIVWYHGDEINLLNDRPAKMVVKENIIAFTDKGNNFWCFYKGKKYWLERYIPKSFKVDNDIIVYQDLDGKLKAFYFGEQVDVSGEIVDEYTLHNYTVSYLLKPYQNKIWCNKKLYAFD